MKPIIAIVADIAEDEKEKFFVYTDYVKAVEEAGGFPVVLPYNKEFSGFLENVNGIILPGGGIYFKDAHKYSGTVLSKTNPKRYKFESAVVKFAMKKRIPLMGICRGAQMIAETLGGKVEHSVSGKIRRNHAKSVHDVVLNRDSFVFSLFKKNVLRVNSFHNKIISEVPPMFRVGAVTEDGVIEVFESRVGLILGFQFHPERLPAQARGKIFRFFISKVLKH